MEKSIQFHHIGVACQNIDKTATSYQILGYTKGETTFDPLQNVNICFLSHAHMPTVELLSPVNEKSPIIKTLEKNGTTPYHTCYVVDDITEAIKHFKANRFVVVSKPKVACAINNRQVSFLFHPDMGLIELIEK